MNGNVGVVLDQIIAGIFILCRDGKSGIAKALFFVLEIGGKTIGFLTDNYRRNKD